ncbi:MAG: type II toxin-antitoxin system ParD family antitoxin [Mesorhizobium sp.]|nr:type II toxin-antitoxin system ParD family antitoxin [Mesorhizobium sp.]
MDTLTVSLPDTMKDWIEAQVEDGTYASASDYVSDLIRRDQEDRSRDHEERLEEIRRIVDEADAGGVVDYDGDALFAEAVAITKARGTFRE